MNSEYLHKASQAELIIVAKEVLQKVLEKIGSVKNKTQAFEHINNKIAESEKMSSKKLILRGRTLESLLKDGKDRYGYNSKNNLENKLITTCIFLSETFHVDIEFSHKFELFYWRIHQENCGVANLSISADWESSAELIVFYKDKSNGPTEILLSSEKIRKHGDSMYIYLSDKNAKEDFRIRTLLILHIPSQDYSVKKVFFGCFASVNRAHNNPNASLVVLKNIDVLEDSSFDFTKSRYLTTKFTSQKRDLINLPTEIVYFLNSKSIHVDVSFLSTQKYTDLLELNLVEILNKLSGSEYQLIYLFEQRNDTELHLYKLEFLPNGKTILYTKGNSSAYKGYIRFVKDTLLSISFYKDRDHHNTSKYQLLIDIEPSTDGDSFSGSISGLIRESYFANEVLLLKTNQAKCQCIPLKNENDLKESLNSYKENSATKEYIDKITSRFSRLRKKQKINNETLLNELYYGKYHLFYQGKLREQWGNSDHYSVVSISVAQTFLEVTRDGIVIDIHGKILIATSVIVHSDLVSITFVGDGSVHTLKFRINKSDISVLNIVGTFASIYHEKIETSTCFLIPFSDSEIENYSKDPSLFLPKYFTTKEELATLDSKFKGLVGKLFGDWNRLISLRESNNQPFENRHEIYRRTFWYSACFLAQKALNESDPTVRDKYVKNCKTNLLLAVTYGFATDSFYTYKTKDSPQLSESLLEEHKWVKEGMEEIFNKLDQLQILEHRNNEKISLYNLKAFFSKRWPHLVEGEAGSH